MKRLEIFANKSVQGEIIDGLENAITDFYYTFIPTVHGRGRKEYRMGTPVWPEENFLLISYISDPDGPVAVRAIEDVKKQFPGEGIKYFIINQEVGV